MLRLRRFPYSLSLVAATKLLKMVAADQDLTVAASMRPNAVLPSLGPEAGLEAQLGRPLTNVEVAQLQHFSN